MMLRVGSQGQEVTDWQQWFNRKYRSYAPPVDGYYGYADRDATRILQTRLGIPVTGEFDDHTASVAGYPGARPPAPASTTWVYTAAGTGGDWRFGPQFVVGEAAKAAGRNHQPLGYPAGGFLGLMGGDPRVSYLDSIGSLDHEYERQIRLHPVGSIVACGYSQSADGFQRSHVRLFGDGGPLVDQRHRLKRVILFGNPARRAGPDAPGSGIARWDIPDWLAAVTRDITVKTPVPDLYACTTDDTLVRYFYPWFIRAETELPFVIYSAQIIIPALLSFVPIAGGFLGPAAAPLLAGLTGIGAPLINTLLGGIAGTDNRPDPELVKLLSVQGILTNLPALIKTLVALAGIQTHGEYHLPKREFDGKTGIDVAIRLVNEIP